MTIEDKERMMASRKDKKVSKETMKISTGIDLLDIALEGGWPVGKIIQVYADSMAGKTRFAVQLIYEAMLALGADKVHYRYNDTENGLSFPTEEQYGYPILGTKNYVQTPAVESLQADVLTFCEGVDPSKGEIGIYIVDSQDALTTLREIKHAEERQKDLKKDGTAKDIGTYGDKAKLLNEFFRSVTVPCGDSNVIVFVISQIRDTMNAMPFAPKTGVSGGHAGKFFSSSRFELKRTEAKGAKDREWGYRVSVLLAKTRTKYERRKVYIDVAHDSGFDNVTSNLMFLYDLIDEKGKEIPGRLNALKWEAEYDPSAVMEASGVSTEEYKSFCKEQELEDDIKAEYVRLTVPNMKKYISSNEDVMTLFADQFGVMCLTDLITYIENNDLEEELTARVLKKWEYLEEKDKPQNRKQRKKVAL